jgi:hypothetical protein
MASSARKAFWLLKSFNHVGTVITMIETYSLANDECSANLLEILEQLFLIIYYFYENLVFMARTKLVSFTEDSIDDWGNMSWFVGDFVCFLAALMRAYISARKLRGYEMLDSLQLRDKPGAQPGQSRSLELQTKFSDSVLSLAIVSAQITFGTVHNVPNRLCCYRLHWSWALPQSRSTCSARLPARPSGTRAWAYAESPPPRSSSTKPRSGPCEPRQLVQAQLLPS